MSDIIFLDPAAQTPGDVVTLGQVCKQNMLRFLNCQIVEETLIPDANSQVFSSKHTDWISEPSPVISIIDNTGLSTLQVQDTDYTVDLTSGKITFLSPPITGTVQASYTFFPFTDTQITEMVKQALLEICNLTYRHIDSNNINEKYLPAICKRLYTNILKSVQLRSKDFFSVSVAGRTINKASIVSQTDQIITQNESQLTPEIDALRYYNQSNRVVYVAEIAKTINSGVFVGQETLQTINSDTEIV